MDNSTVNLSKSLNLTPRKNPRISVNKLAEYLEADSTRRRKIVQDAKTPQDFIVARYKEARVAIKDFLVSKNDKTLYDTIADLKSTKPTSDFIANDIMASIKSLKHATNIELSILNGCEISDYDGYNECIKIAGVEISVNPDLVVKKKVGSAIYVGAIKLHLPMASLSIESQRIVAVMLNSYVESNIAVSPEVQNTKLSISLDVFQERFECCPSSFKTRMKKIEAACEEIALRWDSI